MPEIRRPTDLAAEILARPPAPRAAWWRRAGAAIWAVVLKYLGAPR